MMKRFGIAEFSILLLSIVGYFGYQEYAKAKLMASIRSLVKNASLRVTNAVAEQMETETSRITFKEVFERLERDIAEIDKRILDVQSVATPNVEEKTDVVIAYLKGAQELLRVMLAANRKDLAAHSALERARRAVDLSPESRIELSYYIKSSQRALDDAQEKIKEGGESVREVATVTKKFLETRAKASAVLPTDVLADLSTMERFQKGLEERFPKTLHRVRDRPEAGRKGKAGKEALANAEKQPMSAGSGEGVGAAAPGSGGSGGGVVKAFEFLVYRNQMLRLIRDRWAWVGKRADLEVTVRFGIREKGEITALGILRASGDPSYDDSVLQAVAKASPLPPPPENYRKEFMDVELTFRPKDLGG